MKTISRMMIILVCAALLSLGSLPFGSPETILVTGAAQGPIMEVEPNDDPLSAQEIPFPGPGETVTFQGTIKGNDPGGFSEELETFFSFAGGIGAIPDWIVANPDSEAKQDMSEGPIPLRIEVSWTGTGDPDLDIWVGTTVDDSLFFFDGFKLLTDLRLATSANPESWPPSSRVAEAVAYYRQPAGITSNGNPLPNDGFGRSLMMGIQVFQDVPADANDTATYTVTIQNLSGIVAKTATHASEEHQVDDGGVTTGFFGGPNGGILMNRYNPTGPGTLTQISHPFFHFSSLPDPTGKSVRAIVIAADSDDPTAAPPPLSKATVLFDKMVTIPGNVNGQFGPGSWIPGTIVDVPLDPPVAVTGPVYVGLQWPAEPVEQTGVTLAIDTNPVQYLRTYLSTDNGETWGRPSQNEDLSGEAVFANADIRATFTFAGGGVAAAKVRQPRAVGPVVKGRLSKQPLRVISINR